MLRLLVALALGANTQAFVVAPQHGLPLRSCSKGRAASLGEIGGAFFSDKGGELGPVGCVGVGVSIVIEVLFYCMFLV